MSTPIIGLIGSLVSIIALLALFRFEEKQGKRVIEPARLAFDRILVGGGRLYRLVTEHLGSDLMRQVMHFFVHTVLVTILRFLKRCEVGISNLLRSNRSLAYRARSERATRNKLDEIAEHKAATALSEEERKKLREGSLNSG